MIKKQVNELFLSRTVRIVAGVAGGNLIATLFGVIGSLVQARFVSPSDFGYFRGFSIVTDYAVFLHMGIFVAIQRSYPLCIGKGERAKAQAIAEVSQVWVLAVSLIVSTIFSVLAVLSLSAGNWRATLGWLVQVVSVTSFFYGSYLSATYRSGHDFITVAKASVVSTVAGLLSLPLFAIWPYVALAVRSSLVSIVNLVYLHIRRPLVLRWRFSWREWYGLVREGAPIFFASYGASTGWMAIETTIVLHFLGTQALGFWSMSRMLLEAANKLPQAISAVYIPRVTERFGRTESARECLLLCRKALLLGTPGMLLMTVVCCSVLPFIVPWLMPKYTGAIPTMCLMLLTLPLIVLEIPYALHIAIGNIQQQYFATYVSLAFFVALSMTSINLGWGLNGVVASSLFGRTLRLALTYRFILTFDRLEAS